jgi:hypothetical protein
MVAFRKLSPVFTVLALAAIGSTSAFAQATAPLTCQANAGVPPAVRAEGFTELTGDLVLTCSGGDPTKPFLANFQLFLNTNITSRLLSDGTSEALLMIDEPLVTRGTTGAPVVTPFCVSPGPANNSDSAVQTGAAVATPFGSGAAPACNTSAPLASYQSGSYTVFRGAQQAGAPSNVLVWQGIPVVPPGSNTRTFRITNVRANAAALGSSQTFIPTQIVAYISVFPQGTLPINNPQQNVGYPQPGLLFDVRTCNNSGSASSTSALQCVGVNTAAYNSPSNGTVSAANSTFGLRFREGFQTAFKPRLSPAVPATGTNPGDPGQANSIPGVVYNSESGFVNPGLPSTVGLADSGTRLAARFINIPAGVRIFVGTSQVSALSGAATAALVLTDPSGASTISTGVGTVPGVTGGATITCSLNGTSSTAVEIPLTSGTGTAVWEVTSSNSSANDQLFFLMGFAYVTNPTSNLPALGQAQVVGNFAPFYPASGSPNAGLASTSLPIPRFVAGTTNTNIFNIGVCQTNLLFPYVTNFSGFDTGIAISNTSVDPFGGNQQSGTCTMNYYGTLANGQPPTTTAETTSSAVPAGSTLTFILSGGGTYGLLGNPNFQGYIIATCNFLYAHGFAFITDGPIGQARVAEGYLALVIDGSDANNLRGNSLAEGLTH